MDQPGSLRILVGVCGTINVLNLQNYLVRFREMTESINVIMTKAALRLLRPVAIQAITGNPVYSDSLPSTLPVPHINLARWADAVVILPATANILGKAANGIADDLLSTTILAAQGPILFVPCMNDQMWRNPSVRRNVETLKNDGHRILVSSEAREAFEASSGATTLSHLMPSQDEIAQAVKERTSPPN